MMANNFAEERYDESIAKALSNFYGGFSGHVRSNIRITDWKNYLWLPGDSRMSLFGRRSRVDSRVGMAPLLLWLTILSIIGRR
jgi:hypothetical protein